MRFDFSSPPRRNKNHTDRAPYPISGTTDESLGAKVKKMNRKMILKTDDLNWAIYLFLKEVGEGLPVDWNTEAFGFVRNGIIRAFKKMGTCIEVDDQL